MNWKKYLTLAGGAAAAAVIAYMLVRDDEHQADTENENDNTNEQKKKVSKTNKNGCKMSKEELLELLSEMHSMQAEMKNMINSLILTAKKCKYDFMTVYNEAKAIDKIDPLMKRQMTMPDFDKAVESYHFDPEVNASVSKLVKAPESAQMNNPSRPLLSVDKIIEIHYYMLEELYKVDADFQSLPNRKDLDTKLIALAIQSIVSAKVEDKFNVTSDDVEMSITLQQYILASNLNFAQVNIEMQTVMNKFVGETFKNICDKEDEF